MEYRKFTAKTVEDAITAATMELGVPSDRLDYIVDYEGSSGFFGIGSKNAVIRAREKEEETSSGIKEAVMAAAAEKKPEGPKIKTLEEIEEKVRKLQEEAEKAGTSYIDESRDREPKREREGRGRRDRKGGKGNRRDRGRRNGGESRFEESAEDRFEEREEIEEVHAPSVPKPEKAVPVRTEEEIAQMKSDAEGFLSDVFRTMDMTVVKTISYDEKTGSLNCEFEGDEMGILIGKRGQTLDSLQYLTSLVVNRNQKEYVRVKLDTEEYRKRRRETLESLSRNIAGRVKRSKRAVILEPMNPYERRIIHSTLQNNRYVETYSEGEEPFRRVVVAPKKGNY